VFRCPGSMRCSSLRSASCRRSIKSRSGQHRRPKFGFGACTIAELNAAAERCAPQPTTSSRRAPHRVRSQVRHRTRTRRQGNSQTSAPATGAEPSC
jgi:hypothetical protein